MTLELRNELVSDPVAAIDAALIQIGLGRNAKDAAVTIRSHPIGVLALPDCNPSLDAVADNH